MQVIYYVTLFPRSIRSLTTRELINLGVDCIAPLVIGLLTQSTYFVCKKVRTDFTPLYYGMKEKATRR